MKRIVLLAACLALAACGGSTAGINVPRPEIILVQLVGPAELNWPRGGEIEVQYGARITNKAPVAITLRRIQVQSVGEGGTYALPRYQHLVREEIAAGDVKDITFFARAIANPDGSRSISARSPISIRGVAYFDSESGSFRVPFNTQLQQSQSMR